MSAQGWKRRKRKQGGRNGKARRTESLLEQPTPDSTGGVACELCGHMVDPRRLHFHMVRVHGAAFRPKEK